MDHADELTILIKHTQNVLLQLLLITNTEKKENKSKGGKEDLLKAKYKLHWKTKSC